MKNFVFGLKHFYSDVDHRDEKFLGYFNDYSIIKECIDKLAKLSGFSSYPEGFIIRKYELDKIHWSEGFSSVIGELGRDYLEDEDVVTNDVRLCENLETVYKLSHAYTINAFLDDERIIGVFSSHRKAMEVSTFLKVKNGFKQYPENFNVDEIFMNDLQWKTGF